jgi:hypothetical protein
MFAARKKLERGLLSAITVTLLALTSGALEYAWAGPCSEAGCPTCQNNGECTLTGCEFSEQHGFLTKCIYDCNQPCEEDPILPQG